MLDPPWENASAKRSARYPTLPSRNLLGLPLRQLMSQVRVVSGRSVSSWMFATCSCEPGEPACLAACHMPLGQDATPGVLYCPGLELRV